MNLTNYRSTPVAQVVEMIRREAARYGTSIHHSELVGLIPQEALVEAARYYLQLDAFEPDQILEYRLAAAQAKEQEAMQTQTTERSSYDFLNQLADGAPAPGGGSASAYSGATAAALVSMVARLTIGKKKYADVEDKMKGILDEAETLRQALTQGIDEDAAAFDEVMKAYKLPKDSAEQKAARQQAIEAAMTHAAQVPLEAARKAVQIMVLAEKVVNEGNLSAISDGASASAMAMAALTGAGYNVRINAINLADQDTAQTFLQEIAQLEKQAREIEGRTRKSLIERGGFPLA